MSLLKVAAFIAIGLATIFCCAQTQRVLKLHVTSQIVARFATTHVVSEIQNVASEDKEIFFEARLPSEAFISNFTMKIKGQWQIGEVKEKNEAKKIYEDAKSDGYSTAGLVEQKVRETERFRTSVNVGAGEKVKFDLTYQEVLKRVHGVYKHVVNILSVEAVEKLKIDVFITERGRIRRLHVPNFGLKMGEKTNKELLTLPENKNVETVQKISSARFSTAYISFEPEAKIGGQLVVLYDLERSFNGGEIEVVDGYFVHFFSPKIDDVPASATAANIVFVLDKSGSMNGQKFEQLKDAMRTVLRDLNNEDRFGILWFSNSAEPWDSSLRNGNRNNVQAALEFISETNSGGSTNIHEALTEALRIQGDNKKKTKSKAPYMILILTDGLPSAGEVDSTKILQDVARANKELDVKIHSLAFGDDADYKMLQKLSSENHGLARKIYVASDAHLQLEGFYAEISSPIFTNLEIRYLDGSVDSDSVVRNRQDNTFYKGSEIVIVGRIEDNSTESIHGLIVVHGTNKKEESLRFGTECLQCCISACPKWCNNGSTCESGGGQVANMPSRNSLSGFVEQMWAYLTIKKLLREAKLTEDLDKIKEKKAKALKLSLQYNFVSELTSMVVVDRASERNTTVREADIVSSDFMSRRRMLAGYSHGGRLNSMIAISAGSVHAALSVSACTTTLICALSLFF